MSWFPNSMMRKKRKREQGLGVPFGASIVLAFSVFYLLSTEYFNDERICLHLRYDERGFLTLLLIMLVLGL